MPQHLKPMPTVAHRTRSMYPLPLASLPSARLIWDAWSEAWHRAGGSPEAAHAEFVAWAPAAAAMLAHVPDLPLNPRR